jgi:hypothetical protein
MCLVPVFKLGGYSTSWWQRAAECVTLTLPAEHVIWLVTSVALTTPQPQISASGYEISSHVGGGGSRLTLIGLIGFPLPSCLRSRRRLL